MILSKVFIYLYPRKKQHKKKYLKMIRMVSSKDDTPCDDKAKCIAHWYDWSQILLTKVTCNTSGNQWIKARKDASLHSKQKKWKNSWIEDKINNIVRKRTHSKKRRHKNCWNKYWTLTFNPLTTLKCCFSTRLIMV